MQLVLLRPLFTGEKTLTGRWGPPPPPWVLFSRSGNKPSRKATKFKKLKSINRVDTWNCNLCYHRLPAHFYSTPTERVSKDIAGNRGKRSPFLLFYWILFDLKRVRYIYIYISPSRQMNDVRRNRERNFSPSLSPVIISFPFFFTFQTTWMIRWFFDNSLNCSSVSITRFKKFIQ